MVNAWDVIDLRFQSDVFDRFTARQNLGSGPLQSFALKENSLLLYASTFICLFFSISYFLFFMNFFQLAFLEKFSFWRYFYYALWVSAISLSIICFLLDEVNRRNSSYLILVCAYGLLLTFLKPVDAVTSSFVFAICLVASLSIIGSAIGGALLARFIASITVLSAAICLLDVLFADGFTNVPGRAAGFAVNSNDGAAALLLGAVAGLSAVPARARLPFVVLIGAAIFATGSRSTMLVGAAVTALLAFSIQYRRVSTADFVNTAKFTLPLLILVFFLFAISSFSNPFFFPSMRTAIVDLFSFSYELSTLGASIVGGDGTLMLADPEANDGRSSLSRLVLLKIGLEAFMAHPYAGIGLQQAHELAPHNTFLFFAMAFGVPGVLVPIGFVLLTMRWRWSVADNLFAVALVGLMVFSHSILLFPALLVPIASAIIAKRPPIFSPNLEPSQRAAGRAAVIGGTALFFVGCGLVLQMAADRQVQQLDHRVMWPSGNTFHTFVYPPEYRGLLRIAQPSIEGEAPTLVLLENGQPTAERPNRTVNGDTAQNGDYFRLSRYDLNFTATDNSDPRTNGRLYTVEQVVQAHPLMFMTMIVVGMWCIGLLALLRNARET